MEHLGDGQFASVHACKIIEQVGPLDKSEEARYGRICSPSSTTYGQTGAEAGAHDKWTGPGGEAARLAAKIITKEKVTYVGSLQRIDNEIRTLRRLNHPGPSHPQPSHPVIARHHNFMQVQYSTNAFPPNSWACLVSLAPFCTLYSLPFSPLSQPSITPPARPFPPFHLQECSGFMK